MKCSRCQSRRPNEYCYVCREEETPTETPDENGGSLLKTMYKDSNDYKVRVSASVALICCVISLILLGASGCRDFEGYAAISLLGIMAAFVGLTADA